MRRRSSRSFWPAAARSQESARDLARPLGRSAFFVVLVVVIGVVGYTIIGTPRYGLLDAVYMTVITLTTVGFTEVIDLSNEPAGRVFTVLLLMGGVGSFVYFFSTLTAFVVEGNMQLLLWRRRMSKTISALAGHTIVCGGGNTGEHIVRELVLTKRDFVLIEADADRLAKLIDRVGVEIPAVVGDATEDAALEAAGIGRAAGLVACVSNDKDNLLVVVSARILKPELRVVSRCIDERVESKIRKAGADAIVSPNRIGGLRMVSELVRPTAVSFLDLMLRDEERRLRVEGTEIHEGSALVGKTVAEIRGRQIPDLLLVALRTPGGEWLYNPADQQTLGEGMSVIYLGSPEARAAIEHAARGAA